MNNNYEAGRGVSYQMAMAYYNKKITKKELINFCEAHNLHVEFCKDQPPIITDDFAKMLTKNAIKKIQKGRNKVLWKALLNIFLTIALVLIGAQILSNYLLENSYLIAYVHIIMIATGIVFAAVILYILELINNAK